MQTANKPLVSDAWQKAVAAPASEFDSTALVATQGKIPNRLRGTLYRNGPARLQRNSQRVGHWFDGDGAILAVNFTDGGAKAVYRYVKTDGYLAEESADRYLFSNYGMTVPGPFWHSWGKPVKNAANTSVMALPDKLLALWEGGKPYALDLDTLATQGEDNLNGLRDNQPFSAHPKVDPDTGEIYNFGVSIGANPTLNLYRCNPRGEVVKSQTVALDGIPLIHDFVLAGSYLVFCIPPLRINSLPVLLGLSSYSEAMEWKPQLGTQILVIDRHDLSVVSRIETDPWFQWHLVNGYVEGGLIRLEIIRYQDFATNQNLKEVAQGRIKTSASGTLWQLTIDPTKGRVEDNGQLFTRGCDFPVVAPQYTGKPWRHTYLSAYRHQDIAGEEPFGAIAVWDRQTHTLTVADQGTGCYPSEPIFVPDGSNPDDGWILTVVYDGNAHQSQVKIYRSNNLQQPECTLALPQVIPLGFHGTWHPLLK